MSCLHSGAKFPAGPDKTGHGFPKNTGHIRTEPDKSLATAGRANAAAIEIHRSGELKYPASKADKVKRITIRTGM